MTARWGALRRRRKPSLATRLRIFWVFIVTIVGAAVYAGYILVTLPALRVHSIGVHIDGLAVNTRDVLNAANIDRADNIWLLDTAQIAQRIEAIPYVDAATVRRVPPAQLVIEVTEREPAGCVRSGRQVVTIDASRRILQDGCARATAVQIVVRDAMLGAPGTVATAPRLAALLVDGKTLRAANVGIRSIREDGFGQLVAVGTNGIELLFGSDADLPGKAELVAPVLAAARPGRTVRAIDLRAPATPTVEFR